MNFERLLIGGGTLVVFLLVWELCADSDAINPLFISSPSRIVHAGSALMTDPDFWNDVRVSANEFIFGYIAAIVIGVPLGLLMGTSRRLSYIFAPFVDTLNAVPRVTLLPLLIIWFGIGIWSKVIVVISLVLFPVAINTEAGLRTTSERLIEMLRSFGATRRQIFFKVSLPSAVPFILAGLKLGIGRGLIGVVVAELFGSRAGLGRLISQSADAFNMPELFAGVVVLAVAGIVMTAGFGWLEKRLVPWTKD